MNFGDCCHDLNDAMTVPQKRSFFVQNGVLYLTVAGSDAAGWFDQAILYCPFCGTQLQTKEKIAAGGRPSN